VYTYKDKEYLKEYFVYTYKDKENLKEYFKVRNVFVMGEAFLI